MEITSVANTRAKAWVQLLQKKGREQQGKFLIEGTHLVIEALKSGAEVETVVYSLERGIPEELAPWAGEGGEWIAASDAVIARCTDAQTPQPVFAIVQKRQLSPQCLLDEQEAALVIVVDGVQDPGNLGTIIRSADAVGATGVLLGKGTVDVYNPKTIRSTMGSLFHLPVVEGALSEWLPRAADTGVNVVGTSLQAEHPLYAQDFKASTWIIVGNEAAGVSPEAEAFVTDRVIIPMRGEAESLNVAMAATVLLYEAMRQRGAY
ncbi:rRNA methyltransferase [Paenibacillus swuensis]|uniref:rRNA methyltransferase n=1 Tax=Paenibacillus swuensis TaxID=1178515 RepID=A0A172TDM0_9BACL|nr:RNA methyltransferase [Paenibacillus swuensis]ANE45101.1 rRNA methyltransferase [Paenibacillus swuensis]